MSEKQKFVMAPSRLGRPTNPEAAARPNFTGLKASKLGVLAESKLSSTTTTSFPSTNKESDINKPAPQTFNFTPLTKPADDGDQSSVQPAKTNKDVENKNPNQDDNKSGEFVFGQNLTERVENVVETEKDDSTNQKPVATDKEESKASEDTDSSAKTGDLLFTNSVSPSAKNNADDEASKTSSKTLSESAAEYTENHNSNKRKYDVVDVVTGEETESNVLQANVKLYIFDSDKKNWIERGRGSLRLNDDPSSTLGHLRSRLVMRTVGSLRVVLNTKLFPNMICEKANEKNVRISAMEDNEVKIFLVSGSPKDADKIYTALERRISQLNHEKKEVTPEQEEQPPEKKVAKSSPDEESSSEAP